MIDRLDARWGPHSIDCFPNYYNHKLPRFFCRFWNPNTAGVDFIIQPLRGENCWVVPVSVIPKVLHYMKYQKAVGTIKYIPELVQISKILLAILCSSNFMLPTSTIFAAAWLSVNHLTCEPSRTGAKDRKENSIAFSSLHVELCNLSQSFHILWHT